MSSESDNCGSHTESSSTAAPAAPPKVLRSEAAPFVPPPMPIIGGEEEYSVPPPPQTTQQQAPPPPLYAAPPPPPPPRVVPSRPVTMTPAHYDDEGNVVYPARIAHVQNPHIQRLIAERDFCMGYRETTKKSSGYGGKMMVPGMEQVVVPSAFAVFSDTKAPMTAPIPMAGMAMVNPQGTQSIPTNNYNPFAGGLAAAPLEPEEHENIGAAITEKLLEEVKRMSMEETENDDEDDTVVMGVSKPPPTALGAPSEALLKVPLNSLTVPGVEPGHGSHQLGEAFRQAPVIDPIGPAKGNGVLPYSATHNASLLPPPPPYAALAPTSVDAQALVAAQPAMPMPPPYVAPVAVAYSNVAVPVMVPPMYSVPTVVASPAMAIPSYPEKAVPVASKFVPRVQAKPWVPPGVAAQPTDHFAPPAACMPNDESNDLQDISGDLDASLEQPVISETLKVNADTFFTSSMEPTSRNGLQTFSLQSLQGVRRTESQKPLQQVMWQRVFFRDAETWVPPPFPTIPDEMVKLYNGAKHYDVSRPLTHPNVALHLYQYRCMSCPIHVYPGKINERPADVKLGGVCGDVPALCIAHIVEMVTGVRIQAIDMFGNNLGRCNLWLENPADVPELTKKFDRMMWMSPVVHGYAVVALNDEGREYLLWYLEGLRTYGPKCVRFPRHLVTCEKWVA